MEFKEEMLMIHTTSPMENPVKRRITNKQREGSHKEIRASEMT
jgi:hypothetical protein